MNSWINWSNKKGNYTFLITPLESHTLFIGFRLNEIKKCKILKTPKKIRKYMFLFSIYYRYTKTFLKYLFKFKPIYVIRKEYDYVDHVMSSSPRKYKNGFEFWTVYHKDDLSTKDIDLGYNLYLDFISKEEYENSKSSSRDYGLEAFENGHPSTIIHD